MGILHYKTDWVSLQFEGKFKKHVLPYRFCLVSLRAISKYKPTGAYVWRGDLMEGFLPYDFGGLIFGGAYTWRGLFSEFYRNCRLCALWLNYEDDYYYYIPTEKLRPYCNLSTSLG